MGRVVQCVLGLLLLSLSSCTDLAAVYKHDILILRDAHLTPPSLPPSWESLKLKLPRPLSYPVGLTQDSLNNRLFVAEAKPKEEGKIISLTLNAELEVEEMSPAVKSNLVSVIEGMSYSPKSGHLYWIDSTIQHIYKAMVPKEIGDTVSRPEVIDDLGSRNEPRGLALDPCNEHLYWSEKGGGMVPSSVEMWNPDDNRHHVLQEDEKNNVYQGLSFDANTRNLLWAVTKGDDLNSTCRIVRTSVDNMHHEELVNLENCYPFSLTSDDKYIYWADWGRQGIMRASLTDPSDIIRLVHTPHTTSKEDEHFGVYGLANLLQENPVDENLCKDKEGKTQNYKDNMLQNPAEDSHLEAEEKMEGKSEVMEVSGVSTSDIEPIKESQDEEAEGSKKSPGAGNEKNSELVDNGHSEGKQTKESNLQHKDRIVMSLNHMPLEPQADSPSGEPKEVAKSKSVEAVTGVYNDKTHTDMFASQSTYDRPSTESFSRCYEGQLVIVVLVLAGVSVLLLGSTVILGVILYRSRRTGSYKGASAVIVEAPQAVLVQPPRQVKRFGPKKSVVSGSKSGLSGSATCNGLANDGVSINIEDCCQMTLCETPCYTTVKKQGKSYKDIRKNACDDKKGLLDDSEEI